MSVIFLVGSYLLGAIPFGLLVGKIAGIDVREQGSRNIGATNVSRLLGKKFGIITLLCDVAKGYLPMLIASMFLPETAVKEYIIPLCGLMAVIGHMFPIYLKFKGGKGVATGLGVFLFLSPLAILLSLGVFVAAVYFSGFVSVGSLLSSAAMPIWIWLFQGSGVTIMTATAVATLIWLKHHENIGRLVKGEEKSWKKK